LAESLLSPEGSAQHLTGKVSKQELSPFLKEISAVSASYVSHDVGSTLTSPIKSICSAEAYALYYATINAAKLIHLLPNLMLNKEEISVLDLGSGPGTAGLALLTALKRALHLTCIESSPHMRTVANRLLSRYKGAGTLKSISILSCLPARHQDHFDIVIAANVLAELNIAEGEDIMRTLAHRIAPGGYLVIIEPGQPLHTRRLMHLRNILLAENKEISPLFPCLRRDPCPMLVASETDWCNASPENEHLTG
jgi:ribosomal protein RSM22 (predicted rRNA methylase)